MAATIRNNKVTAAVSNQPIGVGKCVNALEIRCHILRSDPIIIRLNGTSAIFCNLMDANAEIVRQITYLAVKLQKLA